MIINQNIIKRKTDESYEDYFVRLFENKSLYGLDCQKIANILNEMTGNNFGESSYRKEFAAFKRGMLYERNKGNSGIHCRILALSDFHVPFQLPIETFAEYCDRVDVLVLNGDIQDAQSCSKFNKKYRVPFIEEMIECRQYLIDLIEYIHPKKVYITKGNHERRLLNLLSDRINEDLLGLMPDSPLDLIVNDGFKNRDRYAKTTVWYEPLKDLFDNVEIFYNGEWWCKVGKAIFAHPITYSSAMLKTTEKAVNYFLRIDRDFDTCVLAHTHKLGQYIQGGINMFEQGCCCKTEAAEYVEGKMQIPQQKGYMYICQDKNGNIILDKSKLISIDR